MCSPSRTLMIFTLHCKSFHIWCVHNLQWAMNTQVGKKKVERLDINSIHLDLLLIRTNVKDELNENKKLTKIPWETYWLKDGGWTRSNFSGLYVDTLLWAYYANPTLQSLSLIISGYHQLLFLLLCRQRHPEEQEFYQRIRNWHVQLNFEL